MSELETEVSERGVACEIPAVGFFHPGVGGAGDVAARAGGGVGGGGFEPGC